MKLRTRIQDAVSKRLSQALPGAMDTLWDTKSVVVAIEGLSFKSEGGFTESFAHKAAFNGVIRVQLCADNIDALALEPFVMSLIETPIVLEPSFSQGSENEHSEYARLTLKDLKDSLYDQRVVSSLRFEVTGTLGTHDPKPNGFKAPEPNAHLRAVT